MMRINNFHRILMMGLLWIICFILTWVFAITLKNPLLPIPLLASNGFAWHHIPEAFGFLFLGVWLDDIKSLSKNGRVNTAFFILLVITSLSSLLSRHPFVVVPVVTIPSFVGYYVKRLCSQAKN